LLVDVRIRTNKNDESGWPKGFGSGSVKIITYPDPGGTKNFWIQNTGLPRANLLLAEEYFYKEKL
jgi:hypothetical protein